MDEVSIGNNQIYENKQDTYDIRTIRSLIGVICYLYQKQFDENSTINKDCSMVLNTQRERQWNSINMYKNNGDTPCDEEPSIISNDQEKVFKINKNKINSNIITDSSAL